MDNIWTRFQTLIWYRETQPDDTFFGFSAKAKSTKIGAPKKDGSVNNMVEPMQGSSKIKKVKNGTMDAENANLLGKGGDDGLGQSNEKMLKGSDMDVIDEDKHKVELNGDAGSGEGFQEIGSRSQYGSMSNGGDERLNVKETVVPFEDKKGKLG